MLLFPVSTRENRVKNNKPRFKLWLKLAKMRRRRKLAYCKDVAPSGPYRTPAQIHLLGPEVLSKG